jgi:hypothetical protein
MAKYAYTQNTGNLKKFLGHIQSAGIPSKVTQKYLQQCGNTSTNDRALIGVLKAIDFLDQSGAPSSKWKEYRDKSRAKRVLGDSIRAAYGELFATYPQAYKRDEEALRNFFSANTDLGAKALGLTVGTFRALSDLADFDGDAASHASTSSTEGLSSGLPNVSISSGTSRGNGLALNVNIELSIPATDDAAVYENFFAAMKKHLLADD